MAEPRQFSNVFQGVVGGSAQATNTVLTSFAGINTPVINANTWGTTGTAEQVTLIAAGGVLTADHAVGARNYLISFMGRVQKDIGDGSVLPGDVTVHVFVNGAPMTNPLNRCVFLDPNDPPSTFHMTGVETLAPDDTVSIFLENNADTDDVQLIEGATLSIKS